MSLFSQVNLSLFIANRLRKGDDKEGKHLSSISNTIAWVSVAISILVMLVAVAVLGGFKHEIRYKITGFSGSVQLTNVGADYMTETTPLKSDFSYADRLRELDCVESMYPVSYRTGMVKTDTEIHGMLFKGVDSTYNLSFFEKALVDGSLPKLDGRLGTDILISRRVADMLGYSVGDNLLAYFIGEDVKMRKFTVSGIYDIQLEDMDKNLAVIDARHVTRLNGWSAGEASSMEIVLRDGTDENYALDSIYQTMFNNAKDSDQQLVPTLVSRRFSNLFDWLNLLDFNVAIVLLLMIIVAGFNMISSLLIILFEKIPMIGLLKSMGMTNGAVCRVFLCRALFIVGKGILWGTGVALAFCMLEGRTHMMKLDPANYFVDFVPVDISLWDVLLVDFGSLAAIMLLLSLTSLFIARVSPARTMSVE